MQLKLIPRGKVLFISADDGKAVNFTNWANDILKEAGVEVGVECQHVQNQQGNFIIGIDSDSWKDSSGYQRMKALVTVYDKLLEGGIPEEIDGEALLNAVHSGAARGDSRDRVARLNLFINASILDKQERRGGATHTTTTIVDSNAAFNNDLASLTEQYMAAGGDPMALVPFATLAPAIQVGVMKGMLGKLGVTPAVAVKAETTTPAASASDKKKAGKAGKASDETDGGNEPVL